MNIYTMNVKTIGEIRSHGVEGGWGGVYGRICKEEREEKNVAILTSRNRQTNRRKAFGYKPDHMTPTTSNSISSWHPILQNCEKSSLLSGEPMVIYCRQ